MQLVETIYSKFNTELDELCLISKNLYNYANYILRQEYVSSKKYISYESLYHLVKDNENYKILSAQTSQSILRLLVKNWKAFKMATKSYFKNKTNFSGRPKLPKYKDKSKGRNILIFPFQNIALKNGYIKIPKTNFKFKVSNKVNNAKKINQVRIIPENKRFKIEIIYTVETKERDGCIDKVLGIDLGIDNFATCTNNSGLKPIIINGKNLKSINQFYNKKKAKLQSNLNKNTYWSNKLESLTFKRNMKVKDFMHKASKYIIDYCIKNKIDTIVIGKNKHWKNKVNLGNKTNQKFVGIPYNNFISMIQYKCELHGLNCIVNEESYTSKCSALDLEPVMKHVNYKGNRSKRGLFLDSKGRKINADVNGSLNIIRKVVDDELFSEQLQLIEGLVFNPIIKNIL
jgi:putative transposase